MVLLLMAGGCVEPKPKPEVPPKPASGEVSIGYPQEPPGLNPYLLSTRTDATLDILRPVMPTLLSIGPSLNYSAGVAKVPTKTDISKDGTKVTFRINPEAVWSDGVTITASDVVFTWKTIMDARWPVFSRAGYDQIADIQVSGPRSFTLVFKQRYDPWRDLFSAGDFLLPRHALEGKDFAHEMIDSVGVGAGPFNIEKWERGLSISLVPNPRWWGRPARLKRVVIFFVPSIDTAARLFKAKRLDSVVTTSQVNLQKRLSGDGAKVSHRYGSAWWELVYNTKATAVSDVRFRQGIATGVDRRGVIEALFKDEARPLDAVIPGGSFANSFDIYPHDIDKSKRSLEESGYVTRNGALKHPKRSDPVVCANGSSEVAGIFQRAAQKSFDRIGLQLELRNSDVAQVQTVWLPQGSCDLYFVERRGTKAMSITGNFHSRNRPPTGSNFSLVSDGGMDALLDEMDRGVAKKQEVAKKVADMMPVLPLIEVQMLIATRSVSGASANASIDGPFWDLGAWGRDG